LGLSPKELDELQLLSKLHDIGKIGIDDCILNKPDKLSEDEWKIMKRHPEIGHRIAMSSPQLEHIADYILYHHERWDGKGYPKGLKEHEIPVLSRILAVADAYDAMTEDRVYRKALSKEAAIKEIELNAGTQFAPDIARIFLSIMAAS
ncbi:MAG: HD domain-containing protein, partial [Clostridiales bacterium]|nr:HD domain-containing protein [Clostridiales bacterium]